MNDVTSQAIAVDAARNDTGNYRKRPGHVPYAKRDKSKLEPVRVRSVRQVPSAPMFALLAGLIGQT